MRLMADAALSKVSVIPPVTLHPLLPSAEPMLEKMSSPSVEVRRAGFTVAAVGPV